MKTTYYPPPCRNSRQACTTSRSRTESSASCANSMQSNSPRTSPQLPVRPFSASPRREGACDHVVMPRARARNAPQGVTRHDLLVDPETSRRLGRIRQHGTSPELTVRKLLHALGYRFRVHNRDLPGSPDIANRARRWAVFVHGCFWHRHVGCKRATTPTRNQEFWLAKFAANLARDARAQTALRDRRYCVVVVWECETLDERRMKRLRRRLAKLA
jgi:DNA mismatch endonuclease (patch repair protein)